jgi:hypothetical protein
MFIRKRCLYVAVIAVGLLVAGPAWAQDRVAAKDLAWAVSQAPADTWVVAVVTGLQDLETQVKALVGPDADPMKLVVMLDKAVAMDGILDAAGPAVFLVVPQPADPAGGPPRHPELAVMMKIKDPAKLVGDKVEGDILRLRSASGRTVVAQKMGLWAVVSDSVDGVKLVAGAANRITLDPADREDIAGHLAWMRVNPKPIAAMARTALAEAANRGAMPQGPIDFMKLADWSVGLLEQIDRVTVMADVKAEGAKLSLDVALVEGKSLLAMAAAGLPIETFKGLLPASDNPLAIGWFRMDAAKLVPSAKTLLKPFVDALLVGVPEADRKSVDELWTLMEQYKDVSGDTGAVLMEPPAPGQGVYNMVQVFAVKDSAKYREMQKKIVPLTQDLLKVFLGMMTRANAGGPAFRLDIAYKEAAEKIEGLPVDVLTMKPVFEVPPNAPPEAQARMDQMMDTLYGPGGITQRIVILDKTALTTLGGSDLLVRAIKTLRTQAPDLTANTKVAAALTRVPKGSSLVGLMSVPNYIFMVFSIMDRSMQSRMPPEVRETVKDAPPLEAPKPSDLLLITGRLVGKTIHLEIGVPQSEVRGTAQVVKQGIARMQWFMGARANPPMPINRPLMPMGGMPDPAGFEGDE